MYLGNNVIKVSVSSPSPIRAAARPPPVTSCTPTTVTSQQGDSGPREVGFFNLDIDTVTSPGTISFTDR